MIQEVRVSSNGALGSNPCTIRVANPLDGSYNSALKLLGLEVTVDGASDHPGPHDGDASHSLAAIGF